MTKYLLPPCSAAGCKRGAGASINQALLCGEHAVIELHRVLNGGEVMQAKEDRRLGRSKD
jgi:hypothetical protein